MKCNINKGFILFACLIFLFSFSLSVNAAIITWTGGGTNNLASNPDNWSDSAVPQYGDNVIFDATSTKYCTWDLSVTLASLTRRTGYTGEITKKSGVTLRIAKSLSLPFSPSGLNAAVISSSQVNLSWTDTSDNEAGFKIERKIGSDGVYAQFVIVGSNEASYSDMGLTAGTTYFYRVKAYNSFGDSDYSNEANAVTTAFPPTATSDPATYVNGNAATLNASVNPNGLDTVVYFEWGLDTNYSNSTASQAIGSGTSNIATSINITNLSINTIYHYRVVAVNAQGTSYGDDMLFSTLGGTIVGATTISSDTTWTYAGSPYIINGYISVYGSSEPTLTIEPGVEVRFNGFYYLNIGYSSSKGRLVAQGTSSMPIVFTSNKTIQAKGDWYGIRFFNHAASESVLDYVTIEYSGYVYGGIYLSNSSPTISNSSISNSKTRGIDIAGDSSPVITNTTISDNLTHGIYANSTGSLTLTGSVVQNNSSGGLYIGDNVSVASVANNSFANNGAYPVEMSAKAVGGLGAGNTFSGNGVDGIKLRAATVSADTIWRYQEVPYIVAGNVSVYSSTSEPTLTIEPGVEVRFDGLYYLGIGYSTTAKGRLVAQGTSSMPIVFTSNKTTKAAGDWHGIRFFNHAASESVLDYVTVEYAGYTYGDIYLSNSSPAISNSTISNSKTRGMDIAGDSSPVITKSEIKNNTTYGIYSGGTGNVTVIFSDILDNLNYAVYKSALSSVLEVNHCSITGNGNGIYLPTGGNADARFNWWGSSASPSAQVSAGVNYEPWLGAPYTYPFYNINLSATLQQFNSPGGSVNYVFSISDNSTWTFNIENFTGTTLKTFSGSGNTGAVTWDGKDESGDNVSDGMYTYELSSTSLIDGSQASPLIGDVQVDSILPSANISSPVNNQLIGNSLFNIQGTASADYFNNYTIEYGSGTPPTAWTLIGNYTTQVNDGTLAVWDPSGLTDDSYTIRLTVNDNYANTATALVSVNFLNISLLNISPSTFSPNGDGIDDMTTISAVITYPSDWTIDIKNSGGNTVKSFNGSGSSLSIVWDGKDLGDVVQPEGVYSITITATEAASGATAVVTGSVTIDLPEAPGVTTDPATDLTINSATLNATVNPNGVETTVYFQWGTDTSYGNDTPVQSAGSGTNNVSVTANLTGLTLGTTYYYRIVAANISGNAYGDNMSFTTLIEAPSNLTAAAISENQIDLSWTDNSGNETGFGIERKTGLGGTYQLVATTAANIATHSDTGLTAGTTYYYRVRAYNLISNSAYSNEAGVVTLATPPTATTNAATNINGNSVTLNGSVNANGAETTAYFQWGTDISYGNTTSGQSIGSGTSSVGVSVNVAGLIPGTTYHYRIGADNVGGTSYGEDMSFTTPPITIVYPLNGDTISRPDVMVAGTIVNPAGDEIGVTVSGTVATVYGTQFTANHVPLTEGPNTITATATDITGNTSTAAITVNAVTTLPFVTLRANIESGISPLTTYFSVSTEIPDSVASYALDYEGDGTDDYTGTAFDDISVTYQTEGIYYPTITVIDTQGITYSDTMAIVVLNTAELDALLRAKWEGMKNALMAGDIVTAVNYFVEENKNRYNTIFSQLSSADINSIFSSINGFKVYSINEGTAQCGTIRVESGGTFSYPVTFVIDEDGIWKIMGF